VIHEPHAKMQVKGIPHAAVVMEVSGGTAWGYLFSNPDRDDEARARWTADRASAEAEWSVVIGGARDLRGAAGDHIVREALAAHAQGLTAGGAVC
jgi:hypothetical protein